MRDVVRIRTDRDVDRAPAVARVPATDPCVAALGLQKNPYKWWWPFGNITRGKNSWDCKQTLDTMNKSHHCRGHENGRPEYMHRCECGMRWTR